MKDHPNLALDKKNCLAITGFTFNEIIELSGLYGVHTEEDVELKLGVGPIESLEVPFIKGSIIVYAKTNSLEKFEVEIQKSSQLIRDNLIVSTGKERAVAARILKSQIRHALRKNIKTIVLHAYGNHSIREEFNGYVTWGKFGFEMDKFSFGRFNKLIKDHGRKERSLFELLQTEEGNSFWVKYGDSWIAEMNLNTRSRSYKRFKRSLIKYDGHPELDSLVIRP
jgi:hypothetical protein